LKKYKGTLIRENLHKYLRRDPSALSLIISNLVIILLAVVQKWDISVLMWIYWCQSVIIGFSNFARILSLQEFSTKGFRINKKPVAPTKQTQVKTAFFFLIHYGVLHLI